MRVVRSACHNCGSAASLSELDRHEDPRRLVRRLVRHAQCSSLGCPLGMRAFTRVNVYCTRLAIVYTFTKLHDRRVPNVGVGVRVGVDPVEFELDGVASTQGRYTKLSTVDVTLTTVGKRIFFTENYTVLIGLRRQLVQVT